LSFTDWSNQFDYRNLMYHPQNERKIKVSAIVGA